MRTVVILIAGLIVGTLIGTVVAPAIDNPKTEVRTVTVTASPEVRTQIQLATPSICRTAVTNAQSALVTMARAYSLAMQAGQKMVANQWTAALVTLQRSTTLFRTVHGTTLRALFDGCRNAG